MPAPPPQHKCPVCSRIFIEEFPKWQHMVGSMSCRSLMPDQDKAQIETWETEAHPSKKRRKQEATQSAGSVTSHTPPMPAALAAEGISSSSREPDNLYTDAQVQTMIAGAVRAVVQVFFTELQQARGQSPDMLQSPRSPGRAPTTTPRAADASHAD